MEKLETSLKLSLRLDFCIESECIEWLIFDNTEIDNPLCDIAALANFQLPGDGSVSGFISYMGAKVTSDATTLLLRKLEIDVCFSF